MKNTKNKWPAYTFIMLFIFGCGLNTKNEAKTDYSMDYSLGNDLDLTNLKDSLKGNSDFINIISNKGNKIVSTKSKIPHSRNDLDKMRTVFTQYDGSKSAGLTIPGFGGLTLGKDETNLNIYYIETKVVPNGTDSVVYGCGYSIHYLFKKIKKGLDISNLPSIAASVQLENKKSQVYYSQQSYGIIGLNLVKYFKPTINKSLDVEGFGIMQSSIDGIHNILGDSVLSKSVKFTPEILKFIKPYQLTE